MFSSRFPRAKASLIASSVSIALVGAMGVAAHAEPSNPLSVVSVDRAPVADVERAKAQPRSRLSIVEPTYYIVELEAPAMAAHLAENSDTMLSAQNAGNARAVGNRLNLQSIEAREYGAFLTAQQNAFVQQLQRRLPSAEVHRQFSTAMNAVVVKSTEQQAMATLRNLQGVKRVYRSEMRYAMMDDSLSRMKIEGAWADAGGRDMAGEGVRIAIIDSGIRPENPMFTNTGLAPASELPSDDYCSTTDATFCTDKVIVARYSEPTFTVHENEHISPLDYSGHGTHVAGSAAGAYVAANYLGSEVNLSGVAPGAYIMAYKALFTTPTSPGGGSDAMLVEALEHALNDGADVINNSWGGGPGQDGTDTVYDTIFANAEAAGVVVVTAAGNDGSGAETIGCPGCVEAGITVAALDETRTFSQKVSFNGSEFDARIASGDFVVTENIEGPLVLAANVSEGNELGCTAFSENAFAGAIAMVTRGECSFVEKAQNVQAAGAIAMVVGNNESGVIGMALDGITLPSVMVSQSTAEAIAESYEAGDALTIQTIEAETIADSAMGIASFSSRGPNGNNSFLKPDIAAPGTSILSAYSPDQGATFALNSGTSMASPHVAGAAALLRQLRPELDAYQVKSVLMGTTRLLANTTIFEQGTGLVQVDNALAATFALDKGAYVNSDCRLTCTFTMEVTNLTDEAKGYMVTASRLDYVDISVDVGGDLAEDGDAIDLLNVAAGETESFTVTVDSRFAEQGWNRFVLTLTDSDTTQRIPVVFTPNRTDDARVLTSVVSTGEPSWGEKAVVETYFSGESDADNEVRINFPEGVSVSNVQVQEENAMGTFTVNEDHALWTGDFLAVAGDSGVESANLPSMKLNDMPSSMLLGPIQSFGCAEEACDEVVVPIGGIGDLGGFMYNGEVYETLTVWDNGIVAPGDQSRTQLTFDNLAMPDTELPNNVIAPFWTDFVLGGALGGEVYFALATHNGGQYVVIEWSDAKVYSETLSPADPSYTVQVWLRFGEDEPAQVFFNYVEIPEMPEWLTIGMEDISGETGFTYHFDGDGEAVASGDSLEARLAIQDSQVMVSYEVPFNFGSNVTASTDWNTAVQVNVLANLNLDAQTFLGDAVGTVGEQQFSALAPVIADATGNVKAVVTSQHGTNASLSTSGGTITFTPDRSFAGDEVVTYHLEDAAGNRTQDYTLTVSVGKRPNDKKWYEGSFALWLALGGLLASGRRLSVRRR
ncbi:S8 family serine peptidase [Aliidiomarina celeris]|uniref:S8 family serine peptidase n=1 Tax=Aliidiomarina celeris TaxID=2249428 RepID=UPI000DEAA145|nr:S8 family serine peptidase [Aliidiomarina celeris]